MSATTLLSMFPSMKPTSSCKEEKEEEDEAKLLSQQVDSVKGVDDKIVPSSACADPEPDGEEKKPSCGSGDKPEEDKNDTDNTKAENEEDDGNHKNKINAFLIPRAVDGSGRVGTGRERRAYPCFPDGNG
jgi:hypothetical protein